jgi:hypothetical protein
MSRIVIVIDKYYLSKNRLTKIICMHVYVIYGPKCIRSLHYGLLDPCAFNEGYCRTRFYVFGSDKFLSENSSPPPLFKLCISTQNYIRLSKKLCASAVTSMQHTFEVRSYFTTDSQYVLVSSTLVGLATRYYSLSECCCLKFAVLFLWGALSDERTGLRFAV